MTDTTGDLIQFADRIMQYSLKRTFVIILSNGAFDALNCIRIIDPEVVGNATPKYLWKWRNLVARAIFMQLSGITPGAAQTGAHLVKRLASSFRLISSQRSSVIRKSEPLRSTGRCF